MKQKGASTTKTKTKNKNKNKTNNNCSHNHNHKKRDNIPYGAVNLRRNLRRKKYRYLPYGESLTYGEKTKIPVKKLLTYGEKIPAKKTPYVKDAVG